MLSQPVIKLILRHFDCVDRCISKRLLRKRPWSEPSLTSLLCDLLDQDDQSAETMEYTLAALNRDLSQDEAVSNITFEIETHEYPPKLERWVTQADLGLIVKYIDLFEPENSWVRPWLLQAKRLTPSRRNPLAYTGSSQFSSANMTQDKRIRLLQKQLGVDCLRYLLYCPRPEFLDPHTRAMLAHLRNHSLADDIFDYGVGLQLRDDIMSGSPTIAAGIIVAMVDKCPGTLADVHSSIFRSCAPFSWFLVSPLTIATCDAWRSPSSFPPLPTPPDDDDDYDTALGIVSGDLDIIGQVASEMGFPEDEDFRFLPPHTIAINISAGFIEHSEGRPVQTKDRR